MYVLGADMTMRSRKAYCDTARSRQHVSQEPVQTRAIVFLADIRADHEELGEDPKRQNTSDRLCGVDAEHS